MNGTAKFLAGALVGLVAAFAVGVPVVHYAENGGARVFAGDIATAVLGEDFRPAGTERPPQTKVARILSEPAPRTSTLPRVRPLPQLPRTEAMAGVTLPAGMNDLMSGTEISEIPSIKLRPGETPEQAMARQITNLEGMVKHFQVQGGAMGGDGLFGALAASTCLGPSRERQHAGDRLDDLTRCAASMGASAAAMPGGAPFDAQALIDGGTRMVVPDEVRITNKRACWGEAPADLSPRERALRNEICDRLMKAQ